MTAETAETAETAVTAETAETAGDAALRGLRANSLAAIVILLVEYGLGVWVSLYGHPPVLDRGANLSTAFGRAVADGPVGLSMHALLGVVLIVSAATALVRSILVRRPRLVAAAAAGLVAIVSAAVSGASFVGDGAAASSMAMAVATGVAIASYALLLFLLARRAPARP